MCEPGVEQEGSRAHFLCREQLKPVRVRRIDWFRVISDLMSVGFSMRAVASLTGVNRSVLLGLRNNDADPKMRSGEAILALWSKATGQPIANVPRWGDEYKPRSVVLARKWDGTQVFCPLCGAEHHVAHPKGPKRG